MYINEAIKKAAEHRNMCDDINNRIKFLSGYEINVLLKMFEQGWTIQPPPNIMNLQADFYEQCRLALKLNEFRKGDYLVNSIFADEKEVEISFKMPAKNWEVFEKSDIWKKFLYILGVEQFV